MVFNATFNNISDIPWMSVLFVEEIGGPGKKVTDKRYHIMLYRTHNISGDRHALIVHVVVNPTTSRS